MLTTLLTVEAYTSAGDMRVWPVTFFTVTSCAVRPLCRRVVPLSAAPTLLARAPPPKPAPPPTTAQASTRAVTFTPVFFQKEFFFLDTTGASVRPCSFGALCCSL